MNTIWVLLINTESGDTDILGYYTQKPDTQTIQNLIKDIYTEDYEAETIYYKIHELEPLS